MQGRRQVLTWKEEMKMGGGELQVSKLEEPDKEAHARKEEAREVGGGHKGW